MEIANHLSKHLHDVHFGGNWSDVNLEALLEGLTWQQATHSFYDLNSIATLVFHTNYYIAAVSKVLEGEPLKASDSDSFKLPHITSETDWEALKNKAYADAKHFSVLIQSIPTETLWQEFEKPEYGNYFRNIQGIIEHTHYHLGQIAIIRKMLTNAKESI